MGGGARAQGGELSAPRLIQLGLLAIAGASVVAALVGLPLFGDGAYYYFKLATDAEPVVPNLRYAAVLAQLPAWTAAGLGADALLLRHCFAVAYAGLPVVSLLICWLAVRCVAPQLILFPALSLLAGQINFSAVSELVASLHLTWPLLLMMALTATRGGADGSEQAAGSRKDRGSEPRPRGPGKPRSPRGGSAAFLGRLGARQRMDGLQVYALCTGPLLLLLHPMAFMPGLLLSLLALLLYRLPAEGARATRRIWLGVGVWLAVCALLRLGWTLVGANAYERSNLEAEGALHYLLASTLLQHLLLAVVVLLGVGLALSSIGRRRPAPVGRLLTPLGVVALLLSIAVGAEFLGGDGIKLKAALTFVVALVLMVLAAVAVLVPVRAIRADQMTSVPRTAARRRQPGSADAAPLFALCALAVVLLMLAKSSAWWTATRGLQNVMVESEDACIEFGPQQPFGLQWPWMAVVDDWATPMNALAFRPRGGARWPIALLLPYDGCRVLEETGVAHLTSWLERPWTVLDAVFGPLRPIEFQSPGVYPAPFNFAPSVGD